MTCATPKTPTACETLQRLRAAEVELVTGAHETKVRYRSDTGSEQEVHYSKVAIEDLHAAIRKYEALCAAENPSSQSASRRRCFTAGL